MMKKVVVVFLAVMLLSGCWESQDEKDQSTADEQQKQYAISQPVPQFDWSLERDLVIQLYQARNREVATHTVWRSNYGAIEDDCPSIGFPIPYDTSLTNPLKSQRVSVSNSNAVVLEQAEPNGVFASKNSIATWVMCVIKDGDLSTTVPIYVEAKATAYPFPVIVDYETNRVTWDGKPSVTIKSK